MPSRRRGGGRGGSNRPEDRETQVSKALSLVLRHRAKELGLPMDERGYVPVAALLSHQRFRSLHLTLAELQSVVKNNAKQRFELTLLPAQEGQSTAETGLDQPENYIIRATQGHSITGLSEDGLLTPILATDADFPVQVVHGTYSKAWDLIHADGGLRPMERTHVHFAERVVERKSGSMVVAMPASSTLVVDDVEEGGKDGSTATTAAAGPAPVISGMRASATILIWVDVRRALDDGVRWWRSKNGVVLTDGKEGLLSLDYVSRVVDRRSGKVLWKNEWWDEKES